MSSNVNAGGDKPAALESTVEAAFMRSVTGLFSRARTHATTDTERSLDLHESIHTLEDEMDKARRGGVLGLMRLRYEAWVEERMVKPAQMKLESKRTILEEQKKTAQAQIELRATIQGGEQRVEKNRMDFEGIMWQRLAVDIERTGMLLAPAPNQAQLPSASAPYPTLEPVSVEWQPEPPVQVHTEDEQIETLALRAVMNLGNGEGSDALYAQCKEEVRAKLPPHTAREVERRIEELRRMTA